MWGYAADDEHDMTPISKIINDVQTRSLPISKVDVAPTNAHSTVDLKVHLTCAETGSNVAHSHATGEKWWKTEARVVEETCGKSHTRRVRKSMWKLHEGTATMK
jgi:hypothetical protein